MPVTNTNGILLAYDMQGAGHPLVLISGVGYGAWYWRGIVPELARHYQVVTFDNRGAGGSDKPDGPYTTPMMAADTIGLLEDLGIASAYVLGHSLGGFVAQELALARPDLVGRLILAATHHGGPGAIPVTPAALDVLTNRAGDRVDLFRRGMAVSTGPGFAERHPEIIAELFDYRMTNPVPPAQYAAQVGAGAQHDTAARLHALACPTLVLSGSDDQVVPAGNAELLAAKIPGAQVTILPGLGHHFPIEDPAATIAAIRAFLDR
jgi:pimeloyl-ACP methyl ester carboxylesterase